MGFNSQYLMLPLVLNPLKFFQTEMAVMPHGWKIRVLRRGLILDLKKIIRFPSLFDKQILFNYFELAPIKNETTHIKKSIKNPDQKLHQYENLILTYSRGRRNK